MISEARRRKYRSLARCQAVSQLAPPTHPPADELDIIASMEVDSSFMLVRY